MRIKIGVLILLSFNLCLGQTTPKKLKRPKLVVGIVVDQMRYDFLYRYYDKYSNGGFKRLMDEGFNCKNNQYHYASTVTGPGHAHSFNGSIPGVSGIVGNEWFDKATGQSIYVAADSTVSTVGEGSASAGKMSPRNMKVTSICDQMRIATQFKSKSIGIAIKDRGAIMPVGHTGDAYWYDASSGNWITSTYYKSELPKWVSDFNAQKSAEEYIKKPWELLLPENQYTESEGDQQNYENVLAGETKPVFPHKITKSGIANSYYGNELTKNFALKALSAEGLGLDAETDFLTISFSSPDYVGHTFGPQSVESEDVYLRLDKNLEELLNTLDVKVGKGQYTVFLTADHGVAEIPGFLMKHKIPAGIMLASEMSKAAEITLNNAFGEGKYIINEDNYQFYMNMDLLASKKVSLSQVQTVLRNTLQKVNGVFDVVNLSEGNLNNIPTYFQDKFKGLYNPKRSGEIQIILEPAWFSGYTKGTTHGTMYSYDTHVPLLFYGYGVQKGQTYSPTYISDIASTLASLLSILEPNGNVGKPIGEALKK
jgi:predicted AlkP superfamily pyrophosphatase or phosphodiesterase